jgi:putative methylase
MGGSTKKRQLEMALQKLRPLISRSPRLEQYPTPADIAADLLWEALGAGDIEGKDVIDLGCGNGILAIGAMLLGAQHAVGIDIDPEAIKVAEQAAADAGVEVEFFEADVSTAKGSFDTALMNPPFGAQTKHADRPFIEKALQVAHRTYSLHNDGTEAFIEKLVSSLGGVSLPVKRYKFEIPYAFEFHRKATESVSVVLLRFER